MAPMVPSSSAVTNWSMTVSSREIEAFYEKAQNTTREQMKMFLTRIGTGSRAIVTGDVSQIDLPRGRGSGLVHARQVLSEIEQIAFIEFSHEDVVRHSLVAAIIQAYEKDARREG